MEQETYKVGMDVWPWPRFLISVSEPTFLSFKWSRKLADNVGLNMWPWPTFMTFVVPFKLNKILASLVWICDLDLPFWPLCLGHLNEAGSWRGWYGSVLGRVFWRVHPQTVTGYQTRWKRLPSLHLSAVIITACRLHFELDNDIICISTICTEISTQSIAGLTLLNQLMPELGKCF